MYIQVNLCIIPIYVTYYRVAFLYNCFALLLPLKENGSSWCYIYTYKFYMYASLNIHICIYIYMCTCRLHISIYIHISFIFICPIPVKLCIYIALYRMYCKYPQILYRYLGSQVQLIL